MALGLYLQKLTELVCSQDCQVGSRYLHTHPHPRQVNSHEFSFIAYLIAAPWCAIDAAMLIS